MHACTHTQKADKVVYKKIIKKNKAPTAGLPPESVVTDSPKLANGICGLQDTTRPWKMTDKLLSPSPLSAPVSNCPMFLAPSCRGAARGN